MKADQQTKSAAHRVTHYHLGDDAPFCGAKVKAPQLSSDEFEVTCKRCLHKFGLNTAPGGDRPYWV